MSMGKWWMGIVCCLVNGAVVVGQPSSTIDVDQQLAINDQQESLRDGELTGMGVYSNWLMPVLVQAPGAGNCFGDIDLANVAWFTRYFGP